jgi:hypothetical protein
MDAAMDIGIVALVVALDGMEDRAWFLRRGGVVEIDERMAVDFLTERGFCDVAALSK